jgi:inner membrane protein
MDPITHTLTGAALSRTGYHRATPLATATLILAANAPDIDILTGFGGDYATVAHRRGWTHGPLALVLLPFVVMGVMLAYDRWVRRRRNPDAPPANAAALFLLALLGTATHPLLDWMNTYGIRLMMPFRQEWYYGDALFIVDPWVWLILGGGVYLAGAAARYGRGMSAGAGAASVETDGGPARGIDAVRVGAAQRRWRSWRGGIGWGVLAFLTSLLVLSSPIPRAAKVVWVVGLALICGARAVGARVRASRGGERLARWSLGFAVVYITLMVVASGSAAREVRETLIASGFEADQVMVAPEPANPFQSSVLATTSTAYLRGSYQWLARPRFQVAGDPVSIPPRGAVTDAAAATLAARRFLTWSRFPVFQVEEAGEGYLVRIVDLRFEGGRDGGLGGLMVRLDRELGEVQ